ncbi:hypothetical protein VSU19_05815 [Verrucomicrobiales bacterium BCK34]|nr:hypothetical protein [Verrucomicrobiales bacterium BCK34]
MNTKSLSVSKSTTRTFSRNSSRPAPRPIGKTSSTGKVKAALRFIRDNAIGCDVFVGMMHGYPLSAGK